MLTMVRHCTLAFKRTSRYKDVFLRRLDVKKFLREDDETEQPVSRIHALVEDARRYRGDARRYRGVTAEFAGTPSVLQGRNRLLATALLLRCDYIIIFDFVAHLRGTALGGHLKGVQTSFVLIRRDCETLIQDSQARLPARTGSRRSLILGPLRCIRAQLLGGPF